MSLAESQILYDLSCDDQPGHGRDEGIAAGNPLVAVVFFWESGGEGGRLWGVIRCLLQRREGSLQIGRASCRERV